MLEDKLTKETEALIEAMHKYKPYSSKKDEDLRRIRMADKVQKAWQQYLSKNGNISSIASFYLKYRKYF